MTSEPSVLAGRVDEYHALTLVGPDGALRATFLPSVGMVCCSLLFESDQLLALGKGAVAYEQHGSTFGIPLLHPWANRLSGWSYEAGGERVEIDPSSPLIHPDGATGLPIHGLLAASRYWAVTETSTDSEAARLRAELDFAAHPDLLAAFPFPHRLELRACVQATRLSVRLTLIPSGAERVPISFGFHPYLRLPGSDRRSWSIELPVRRRALLDERGIPSGASEPLAAGMLSGPLGERTFDDCFDQLDPETATPIAFSVADQHRRVAVEFVEGYTIAQVFAPKASSFICFEPMTAPVDALTNGQGLRWAEPGSRFSAEFAIDVTES